jgi:hypothetical protein
VFTDFNGKFFTLTPGCRLYERFKLIHFNDEEGEQSAKLAEVTQLAFASMTLEKIEKEYGPMNRVQDYEKVVESRYEGGKVPNVFDP